MFCADRVWKGDISFADTESMLEDSPEKRFECRENGDRAVSSQSKIDQLGWREKIRFSASPPQIRVILHETRSTMMFSKENRTRLSH